MGGLCLKTAAPEEWGSKDCNCSVAQPLLGVQKPPGSIPGISSKKGQVRSGVKASAWDSGEPLRVLTLMDHREPDSSGSLRVLMCPGTGFLASFCQAI